MSGEWCSSRRPRGGAAAAGPPRRRRHGTGMAGGMVKDDIFWGEGPRLRPGRLSGARGPNGPNLDQVGPIWTKMDGNGPESGDLGAVAGGRGAGAPPTGPLAAVARAVAARRGTRACGVRWGAAW